MEVNNEKEVKVKREDWLRFSRFEEVIKRLYAIHEMRWNLLSAYPNDTPEETEKYILSNEILGETEKKLWAFIIGKSDTY